MKSTLRGNITESGESFSDSIDYSGWPGVFHSIQRERIRKTEHDKSNGQYIIDKKRNSDNKKAKAIEKDRCWWKRTKVQKKKTDPEDRITTKSRNKLRSIVYRPHKKTERVSGVNGSVVNIELPIVNYLQKRISARELNNLCFAVGIGDGRKVAEAVSKLQKISGNSFSHYDSMYQGHLSDLINDALFEKPQRIFLTNRYSSTTFKIMGDSPYTRATSLPSELELISLIEKTMISSSGKSGFQLSKEILNSAKSVDFQLEKYFTKIINDCREKFKNWKYYASFSFEDRKNERYPIANFNLHDPNGELKSSVSLHYRTQLHLRMDALYKMFELELFNVSKKLSSEIHQLMSSFGSENSATHSSPKVNSSYGFRISSHNYARINNNRP